MPNGYIVTYYDGKTDTIEADAFDHGGSRIAFYKRKSNANPRFHGELTGSIAAWTVNSLVKAS